MKPDAWILKTGHGTSVVQVKPACEVDLWEPLYSAETIRKWLEEEPSKAMIVNGLRIICNAGSLVSASEVFEEMITAKLEELK